MVTAVISGNVHSVPICIFNNDALSALEAISKYFKEVLNLRYCDIASILNRDDRTIWGAYDSAKKKMSEPFKMDRSDVLIPVYIFEDRNFSVLETITKFLKDELNFKYCQIARLMNRDDRTIWTVYNRAKKKNEKA